VHILQPLCNVQQHTRQRAATRCNTLQHAATRCNSAPLQRTAPILQRAATHTATSRSHSCNALQHMATRCNTHGNALQHTRQRAATHTATRTQLACAHTCWWPLKTVCPFSSCNDSGGAIYIHTWNMIYMHHDSFISDITSLCGGHGCFILQRLWRRHLYM